MKKLIIVLVLINIISLNISANETITLSTGEWAPYTSKKNFNKKIAQTIVTEAFKLENITLTIKYYPWKRAYVKAKNLELDATFPWEKTKTRETDFYYSKQAILKTKTVFFHLKDFDFKWNNFDDLKKYKIGGTLGFNTTKLFLDKGLHVEKVPTAEQNFRKLLKGRIDITASSYFAGYNIINKSFSTKESIKFTNHPKQIYPEAGVYFLISKKHPRAKEIMKKFDNGLKKLIKTEKYMEILKSWE